MKRVPSALHCKAKSGWPGNMSAVLATLLFVAVMTIAEQWQPPYSVQVTAIASAEMDDLDEVQLTISNSGIEPSEMTRGAGKFLLSVDNKSGAGQLTLRLDREGGEHVRDIKVPEKATDWAEEVELQAGRYVLTETSHPNWTCRINVQ